MSPKWPYDVGVTVSLDGGRAEGIDLQDYGGVNVNDEETVASAVVWGVSGLTNGQHRLIVTPASTKTWAVLDALVYVVEISCYVSNSLYPPGTPSQTILIQQPPRIQKLGQQLVRGKLQSLKVQQLPLLPVLPAPRSWHPP